MDVAECMGGVETPIVVPALLEGSGEGDESEGQEYVGTSLVSGVDCELVGSVDKGSAGLLGGQLV